MLMLVLLLEVLTKPRWPIKLHRSFRISVSGGNGFDHNKFCPDCLLFKWSSGEQFPLHPTMTAGNKPSIFSLSLIILVASLPVSLPPPSSMCSSITMKS